MPAHLVRDRLDALYRRHLAADDPRVARFYDPKRGYYGPGDAGDERNRFGICVVTVDGETYRSGDATMPFALQSISKVFAYACALEDLGPDKLLERVGVEPSGDAFSSITVDERHGRPYNAMVNAGALVTSECVRGSNPDAKLDRILDTLRAFAGDERLEVDPATLSGELGSADLTRATAYLLKSRGMLAYPVESTVGLYLRQCSVGVTCVDLATMAATLANGCVNPLTGVRGLPRALGRHVLSVMFTCGMYDFAGQWAYQVGLPAKSGVSGGIIAVVPGKLGIGVYSPGLDEYGNSVRGIRVCEEISTRLGLHVFASSTEDAILAYDSTPADRP